VAAMVKSDLSTFWAEKEQELGRKISVYEVAKATNLAWETVANIKDGKTERFDGDVIGKLCAYFNVPHESPVPFLKVYYNSNGGVIT
jgi:DNA-binding Xre family transcriptional regulator